jgi:elongation factor 2
MGIRKKMVSEIQKMMFSPENIRNIGIAAHIDHGKTTLSDNLLAAAGLISPELAGSRLYLDSDVQEQARGITINAANVSMVHDFKDKEFLINMIDTPGHVDFGGDVTRAMRAVDGVIVVACAVEGCMPQTETVVRQALKERVKPVLFINKVDRLINEIKLTPEEMQNRFMDIINNFNKLVRKSSPKEFKNEWVANVADGTVAFGSAYYNWAINVPFMKEFGITFKDIIEHNQQEKQKDLAKKAPIAEILLDMVVKHLPNPVEAQKYRIPKIWSGDVDSDEGKAMAACDQKAPLAMMITDITIDPNAGEIATGRVFSGSIQKGSEVYLFNMKKKARIQQVGIYMGAERVIAENVPAGNIAAITGLKEAIAGETLSSAEKPIAPFEEMKHTSDPVVTKAIEAKNMKDLPKLIEVLRQLAKEDPTLRVEINEETGEHLLSGMGELHLEITEYRIKEKGVDILGSKPIVVYRESVTARSGSVEGKSPNKHNRFYFVAEPLNQPVLDALLDGDIKPDRLKGKELGVEILKFGMDKLEAKGSEEVHLNNLLTDVTKGIQYLNEVMPLIKEGFHEAMDNGPMAKEKVLGVKVKLVDVKLHEDSIHRGPAQVIPAVRDAIRHAMLEAKSVLLEPKQKVFIHVPEDYMGGAIREVQGRRGQILEMKQEQDMSIVEAKCPVAELFGFASSIRSATEGRALWSTEHSGYEIVPRELQDKLINEIRARKGI